MAKSNTAGFVTKTENGWTVHSYLLSTPEHRVKFLIEMMEHDTIYDDMDLFDQGKPAIDPLERATDLLWGWIKQGVLKKKHLKQVLRSMSEK